MNIRLYQASIIAIICLAAFTDIAQAKDIESLQKNFIELPKDSQRLTGPLFWLHGDETKEKLEDYVQKVAEGGNGCFTAESRPHNDWLGDNWYRDLQICLDAAKKNNLLMWIFDERWWPSGEVGGAVPQQYGSKYIQTEELKVNGSKEISVKVNSDKLIAVLAGLENNRKIDPDSIVDLSGNINNNLLDWQAPAGNWKVMVFHWKYSDGRYGHYLVDGASRDAVDWYIQTVYQPHYDHFKDDFGTWIPGFFYDEPETYGDWGTEVIPLLKQRGIDWKKALVAWKFQLNGPQQAAAKYQYQDAFAQAWGQTLFGGITEWCHQHKVLSIGHFLEHEKVYLSPHACAGNMFQLQKYSDMGAIDAVFRQFEIGRRGSADRSTWMTPKLGSSISHVYGKTDDISMVEIFGARGQDLTYPEMKWWTDHMHVSGINFHIPHSFNPRSPYDTDCPPYFYNGGKEPRWPLYKVYADYTSRLSLMLTGGRHVCPVALLFLGNSYHVGKSVLPELISESLQDALYDCDWMPYDVFEQDVKLDSGSMKLYQEQYRVLIVPPVEVIPYQTLARAYEFFASGGIVIGYDFLPSKSADLDHTADDIKALCDKIWGNAQPGANVCRTGSSGGRSYFLPANPSAQQLQAVLADDAGVRPTLEVIDGDTNNWLHTLHRVKDGRNIFFVCNQNADNIKRSFTFRIQADGFPEYWDPMRAEITSIPFVRKGSYVELAMALDPLESALLVFNPLDRHLPPHIDSLENSSPKVISVKHLDLPAVTAQTEELDTVSLDDCDWVWLAGQDAARSAPPGQYYFRGAFKLTRKKDIARAQFVATADNELELFINGRLIPDRQGSFTEWRRVSDVDVTDALTGGRNSIAIKVVNTTNDSSPAGLIGKLQLTHSDGTITSIKIDPDWKATDHLASGWHKKGFNDSTWPAAAKIASFGQGPWGTVADTMLTLSPVKQANPFLGQFELLNADINKYRYILNLGSVQPETAVRITVNGKYAGGCIGNPLTKDITGYITAGRNSVLLEPFTPDQVQILIYPLD